MKKSERLPWRQTVTVVAALLAAAAVGAAIAVPETFTSWAWIAAVVLLIVALCVAISSAWKKHQQDAR